MSQSLRPQGSALLLTVILLPLLTTASFAQQPKQLQRENNTVAPATIGNSEADFSSYCKAVAEITVAYDVARDRTELRRMAEDISVSAAELETKIATLKDWVGRRDSFIARAQDTLVKIFNSMQPEAAAVQLAAMVEETSAAVILKLDAKAAAAILGEMEAGSASRISTILSAAADMPPGRAAAVESTKTAKDSAR